MIFIIILLFLKNGLLRSSSKIHIPNKKTYIWVRDIYRVVCAFYILIFIVINKYDRVSLEIYYTTIFENHSNYIAK